jgi:5-oxoprolinase (ATP-hydrolysing) subunit A
VSSEALAPTAGTATRATVDLNADLGESFGRWSLGDDASLIPLITSANVACGFHAGDPLTLRRTVAMAVHHGVVIGAQVGYRDLAGFGRRFLDVDPEDLTAETIYQIGALDALCRAEGGAVRYVKPHGALYNAIVHHRAQAEAVVAAVATLNPRLPVLGLPGSVFLEVATAAGLSAVAEAFADRGYHADGTLVPRGEPGALIGSAEDAADRVAGMVKDGVVKAVDGQSVSLHPRSICLHGDSPGAVGMARAVRDRLDAAGVLVAPFVS